MNITTEIKATLIADSGATKTDWCLIQGGDIIKRFIGKGISPIFQTQDEISEEVKQFVYPNFNKWNIDAIHFYGTGCIPEKIPAVRNALHNSFPIEVIDVYSDLVAAAHSLCGRTSGIACILGTGSNSCEWDGDGIVNQISPLGFILGDEGSGASLGKKLVGDALKNQLTPGLKEAMLEEFNLTPTTIIDKVYRQQFPSRFLASLSPFINANLADETIKRIVVNSFTEFFERNIMQYNYKENRVNFVGSIAWYYSGILRDIAQKMGIEIGKIIKSPMDGLVEYYS